MNNPFAKFQRLNQTRSQQLPGDATPIMFSHGKIVPNKVVTAASVIGNSDLFAVINLLASDIADSEFKATVQYQNLLEKPNNKINAYSFWQSVAAQLLIHGNAYVINQGTELELAPTENVNVILTNKAEDLVYDIRFDDERGSLEFQSKDIFHFRLLPMGEDYTNQYIGISPLQSLFSEINIQDFSNRLTLSTLKNAISPSITLTVPQGILDKDAKENIRKGFEDQNSGPNAGRAVVLDQGLKLDTIQINSDVATFLKNFDFGKTQIAKAYGIPDSYLNGQGDQQSSLDMTKNLYANALQRYIKPIESELTAKLNSPVKMDFSDAIDANNSTLRDTLVKLATSKNSSMDAQNVLNILSEKGALNIG